jgi:hypothetical protein
MSTRTITGRLAADPAVQKAGRMDITKFTVMENTGRYRAGEWVPDDAATRTTSKRNSSSAPPQQTSTRATS